MIGRCIPYADFADYNIIQQKPYYDAMDDEQKKAVTGPSAVMKPIPYMSFANT